MPFQDERLTTLSSKQVNFFMSSLNI